MTEQRTTLSRRDFLRMSAVTAAAVLATACAKPTSAPEPTKPPGKVAPTSTPTKKAAPTDTPEPVSKYGEAPMLAELVEANELPPVDERLPKDPLVLDVVEEIGQYGGTIRTAWKGRVAGGPSRFWTESLLQFSPDGTEIGPNVFAGWEVSEGGKAFTFEIREGMKWSDGIPVTADDFLFWYEAFLLNEELTPVLPSWMKTGDEPGVMEKVDDFTLRFRFEASFPLFILHMAEPKYMGDPKHYMEQFHPEYASKEDLDKLIKEAQVENWAQLYAARRSFYENPEAPAWNGWLTKSPTSDPHYVTERNPYYWKVDPVGNQLPYVDRVVWEFLQESELFIAKCIAGELDWQHRYLKIDSFPILKENEEKGDYRVLIWRPILGTSYQLMFNQTHEADPAVAKYITSKKFRQALSLAIDRDDFSEVLFLGKAIPRQVTTLEVSPDSKPEYATRYTEFDPDTANKWLDELGLDKRDKDGFRIAPETGEALTLMMSIQEGRFVENGELIREYWEDNVGIKTVIISEEANIHAQRRLANEFQVSVYYMDHALYPLWLLAAHWIVPCDTNSRLGTLYGLYHETDGEQGKKPEGDIAKALDLYDQAVLEVDEAKRIELCSQILDITTENLWAIGTVLLSEECPVVKNNLRNVPEEAISDWTLRTARNAHPEQFFFRK